MEPILLSPFWLSKQELMFEDLCLELFTKRRANFHFDWALWGWH